MRRREFIALLGGGLVAWPLADAGARNASDHLRRIGVLSALPLDIVTPGMSSFQQGLRDLGWHPGQDIAIEYRSAEGHFDRLPGLAAELANVGVELILAISGPETKAAKAATNGTIPIVFAVHGDPIGAGDIQSLARPGGTITGISQMHPELSRKQLELLKECVPALSRIAVMWNSANPIKARDWDELKPAARALGLQLESLEIRSPADLDGTLISIRAQRPDGLLILGDPLTATLQAAITTFAIEQHLPAMYPFRAFVDVGGLMSYGADHNDLFRRIAGYVDKILNGAKPGDLPVEQPTKFELVINLTTAKMIELSIPPTVLARADEVIE
jgi:putative tryptophan/tyrosine transport system substrate-binding protein